MISLKIVTPLVWFRSLLDLKWLEVVRRSIFGYFWWEHHCCFQP